MPLVASALVHESLYVHLGQVTIQYYVHSDRTRIAHHPGGIKGAVDEKLGLTPSAPFQLMVTLLCSFLLLFLVSNICQSQMMDCEQQPIQCKDLCDEMGLRHYAGPLSYSIRHERMTQATPNTYLCGHRTGCVHNLAQCQNWGGIRTGAVLQHDHDVMAVESGLQSGVNGAAQCS